MVYTEIRGFKEGQVCLICKTAEFDIVNLGPVYRSSTVIVHWFCLILSKFIYPEAEGAEGGIRGYKPHTIKQMVSQSSKVICRYCKKGGATIFCILCPEKEPLDFHLPCGIKNGSKHEIFDTFRSYCRRHKIVDRLPRTLELNEMCAICRAPFGRENAEVMWPLCCKRTVLHRRCVQEMAANAGDCLKCPLCNNVDIFRPQLEITGYYIPETQASWERERNAFRELQAQPIRCEAEVCVSKRGRFYCQPNCKWYMEHCSLCGSGGRHRACMGADTVIKDGNYQCPTCSSVAQNFEDHELLSPRKKSARMSFRNSKGPKSIKADLSVESTINEQESLKLHISHSPPLPKSVSACLSAAERVPASEDRRLSLQTCKRTSFGRQVVKPRKLYEE